MKATIKMERGMAMVDLFNNNFPMKANGSMENLQSISKTKLHIKNNKGLKLLDTNDYLYEINLTISTELNQMHKST